MNRPLIDNWDSHITTYDDIYILGILYKAAFDVSDVLKRLERKKQLTSVIMIIHG